MVNLIYTPWFRLILVIFVVVVFLKVILKFIIAILKRFASFTKTTRDDELINKIETPVTVLIGLLALRFGFITVGLFYNQLAIITNVIDSVVIVIVARIVSIIVYLIFEIWSSNVLKNKKVHVDEQVMVVIDRAIGFLIYLVAFGYILTVWEIDIWPIMGSLGVAGIAFAFALQETLKNLFGGIQLILDKNFKRGDIIELSTGISGTIYDITLRSTRIKTWDNKMIIIPNGVMANDVITNISQPDRSRRVMVSFGVEYGSDPDYVKKIVLEEINKIDVVEKKDPLPKVVFRSMGDSALLFEAFYWVNDLSDFVDARDRGTTLIYERLNVEGIGIPFPQMTIWNNDMGKPFVKSYKKRKINTK